MDGSTPRKAVKRLFADSNVFIQSVLQPGSAPAAVMDLVASGKLELFTCNDVISEVRNALTMRLKDDPLQIPKVLLELDTLLRRTNVTIVPDPSAQEVQKTFDTYMASMRHDADIPILAAALSTKPDCILSGNRQHFNDAVSRKCGIRICSCQEFLHLLTRNPQF